MAKSKAPHRQNGRKHGNSSCTPRWRISVRIISNSAVLFLVLWMACTQISGCKAKEQRGTGKPIDTVSDIRRLAPLLSYVKANGVSVWIEYHTSCTSDVSEEIPLDLEINSDTKNGKGDALSAIQDMVQGDEGVSVSELRPGLVGIKSDVAGPPILQAKLVNLELTETDRYNPTYAIWAGISASRASLQALRVRHILTTGGGLGELPSKNRPHLNPSAKYETLENLLDDVTGTFGGILVYKECKRSDGTHIFDIDFNRKDDDYDFENEGDFIGASSNP